MHESQQVTYVNSLQELFSLRGHIGLVTGASSGLGVECAKALAIAGADVVIAARRGERLETLAAEMRKEYGVRVLPIAADITVEIWQKVMRLNLDAVLYCSQVEAGEMRKARYGKIINTASMSGHIVNTPQNQTPYNVSKAGVIHMTRSLAAEWAGDGIRVNSISPGYTRTALVEKLVSTPEGKKMMETWMPLIPMHRMAEVSDLQGAVVYLASEASDYMTGSDIVIDGGYCVW